MFRFMVDWVKTYRQHSVHSLRTEVNRLKDELFIEESKRQLAEGRADLWRSRAITEINTSPERIRAWRESNV